MKQLITLSALSLLALIGAPAGAQSMDKPLAPSAASAYPVAPAPGLYDALGGQTGLRTLMNDFVNRLKVFRAERNWTQADLAEQLGVSRQTVQALEKGRYDPSLPLAFRIARLFGRPIEAIFVQ